MFLAKQMLSLLHEGAKKPNQDALAKFGMMPRWTDYSRKFSFVLNECEMFAFDRSALVPVSDMRLDTSRGIAGIVTHVTQYPQRMFFECNTCDVQSIMPDVSPTSDSPNQRRAAIIDIAGGGRCTVQPISTVSAFTKKFFQSKGLTMGQAKFMTSFMNVQVAQMKGHVDTTVELPLSPAEFLEKHPESSPKSRISESWSQYELDNYFSAWLDPELANTREDIVRRTNRNVAEMHDDWMGELSGVFNLSFGMAAALELKDTEVKFKRLEGRGGAGRKRRADEVGDSQIDTRPRGLSVVTMHLSQDILLSAYEQDSQGSRIGTGQGSPRALHYVRGHMFLARNGKIVYRKPHFRGQAGLRRLNKVVA